jgi:hypothetical protein
MCGFWVPSAVQDVGGFVVAFAAFSYVLENKFIHIDVLVRRVVSELVGGVVNPVDKKGNRCQRFCGCNVAVAKKKSV